MSDTTASMVVSNVNKSLLIWLGHLPNFAYLIGGVVIVYTLFLIAKAGNMNQRQNTNPMALIGGLCGGFFLISFPSFFNMSNATLFGSGDALTLLSSVDGLSKGGTGLFKGVDVDYIKFSIIIIVIIGFISIVRGCILFSKVMDQNTPGLAQAISHILGGTMAINIKGFVLMLEATTGQSTGLFT